jgi:hypothetical protein
MSARSLEKELTFGRDQKAHRLIRVEGRQAVPNREGRQAVPLEFVPIQLDANDGLVSAEDLHIGHLGELQQSLLDGVVGELPDHRQIQGRGRFGPQREGQHRRRGRRDLEDHGSSDRDRQLRADLLKPVGHVGGRRIEALGIRELHGDGRNFILADGSDTADLLDGRQLFLDRPAHLGFHIL